LGWGIATPPTDPPSRSWTGRLWVRLALVLALSTVVAAMVEFALLSGRTNNLINALPPEIRLPLRAALIEQAGGQRRPLLSLVREQFLLSLGIGMIFSLSVAVLVALRFSAPLEDLATTTKRLAAGDLTARSDAKSLTNEVGALIENVNAMAAQLEQLEANRRYSNAAIAHELRTPLTALRTRVSGLADGVFTLEAKEVLKLHRQLDVLEHLADDLQTLSLADANSLRLDLHDLDWRELIAQVMSDFESIASARAVRLWLEPGGPVRVRGDANRLRQIAHNLLGNALKHLPEFGEVRVALTPSFAFGALRVADSGPGVPDPELPRIFERYYRAEDSRSREAGGSGLGLTIVRALSEAHGGTVQARRADLGGLEIEVRLPLA
jgi:signal transduction histidine kinase